MDNVRAKSRIPKCASGSPQGCRDTSEQDLSDLDLSSL